MPQIGLHLTALAFCGGRFCFSQGSFEKGAKCFLRGRDAFVGARLALYWGGVASRENAAGFHLARQRIKQCEIPFSALSLTRKIYQFTQGGDRLKQVSLGLGIFGKGCREVLFFKRLAGGRKGGPIIHRAIAVSKGLSNAVDLVRVGMDMRSSKKSLSSLLIKCAQKVVRVVCALLLLVRFMSIVPVPQIVFPILETSHFALKMTKQLFKKEAPKTF